MKPSWAETERSATRKRSAEKAKLYSEMVAKTYKLPNGAFFTQLKPGSSEGAESNPEGRVGRRGRHSDAITRTGRP